MVTEIERFSAFVTNTLKFLFKVYFNKMLSFLKAVIPYDITHVVTIQDIER